jgi:hypothetical protein
VLPEEDETQDEAKPLAEDEAQDQTTQVEN